MVIGCKKKAIYLTEREEKILQSGADFEGVSFSHYIVSRALQNTISIDYPLIINEADLKPFISEITSLQKNFTMFVHTAIKTKEVYEIDIQNMSKTLNEIREIERQILREILSNREKCRTEIKKEVKAAEKRIQRSRKKGSESNGNH